MSEPTLYIKVVGNDLVLILVYIDDLLVIGGNVDLVEEFKAEMMKQFKMTHLGLMSFFLGMEITQLREGIFICQQKYKDVVISLSAGKKLMREDGLHIVEERKF